MADIEKLIDEVSNMTVLELSELVKALEEKFDVSAAAPVMAAGMMPVAAAAGIIPAAITGAAALTSNFSSRAFTNSESSNTVILLTSSISFSISAIFCSPHL